MLQRELNAELQKLDEAIIWAQSNLKQAPVGRLLVSTSGKTPRYYHRKTPQDKTGVYLSEKNNCKLISALAQKDYETQLLKAAELRKARVLKAQKLCKSGEIDNDVLAAVYTNLPEARKKYVTPHYCVSYFNQGVTR